jgi:uncharacterized membrane protein
MNAMTPDRIGGASGARDDARIVRDQRVARWLGIVLRVGVLCAGALIVLGLALMIGGRGETTTLDAALGRDGDIVKLRPTDIVDGVKQGIPIGFIELGLLVLILTPTVRVAITAGAFMQQRDRTFVGLAVVVLVILLLGLVGIGA